MGRARDQRGQATSEYIALLAVLAALLTVAGTVTVVGSPGIVNAVVAQLRRALCVVTGGACPADRVRPCVVAALRDEHHVAATVFLVRIDDDHVLLRERLSDGSWRLTIAKHSGTGVEAGIGVRGRVTLGTRSIGLGGELRGALLGIYGDGRVFYARNRREADRLIAAVMRHELPLALDRPYRVIRGLLGGDHGPRPDEVFAEAGLRGLGQASSGNALASGGLQARADLVLGGRVDRRTGRTTVYLRPGGAGNALLAAALGVAAGTGSVSGNAILALTLDRRHKPIELSLHASGAVEGGAGLPNGLAGPLGLPGGRKGGGSSSLVLPGPAAAGRRWELDARLDLADPGVAAAWRAYRRAPTDLAAIRALGERLRTRARLDARTYRTSTASTGLSGGVGMGVTLGGEILRVMAGAQLMAAASRPPNGLWEPRIDCVRDAE